MTEHCHYLLANRQNTPELPSNMAFKVVLIAEDHSGIDERSLLCESLMDAGCLYFMAWGSECREWQDAMNLANLQRYDYDQVPDDKLIIATSHPEEAIKDVFWFSKNTAMHPCHDLDNVLLVHVSERDKKKELLDMYAAA